MNFYIFEDSSNLENLPCLNIEWILILCNFVSYLSFAFLLDASIFTTIDEEKEEQKSTLQQFLKDVTWILGKKLGNSWTQMTLDNLNIQEIELFTNPWKFQPSTPYSSKVIEIWKFDRNGCSGVKSTILNICFL